MNALYDKQTKQGLAFVYKTLSDAFVETPSETLLQDVAKIARHFEYDDLDFCGHAAEVERVFIDRFVVPTSNVYVPLSEARISGAIITGPSPYWGAFSNKQTDHAKMSYEQVGFSSRSVRHFSLMGSELPADGLGVQMAFLSFLKTAAVAHDDLPNVYDRFTHNFLKHHAYWMGAAADIMAEMDDDFYARLATLAAQVVHADLLVLDELLPQYNKDHHHMRDAVMAEQILTA